MRKHGLTTAQGADLHVFSASNTRAELHVKAGLKHYVVPLTPGELRELFECVSAALADMNKLQAQAEELHKKAKGDKP